MDLKRWEYGNGLRQGRSLFQVDEQKHEGEKTSPTTQREKLLPQT